MLKHWPCWEERNMGPVQCFALFGYDSTALVPGAPNRSLTKQLSGEFLILPHINVAVKCSKNVEHILVQPRKEKKNKFQCLWPSHCVPKTREQSICWGNCIASPIACYWEVLTCSWTHSRDISINLQFPSKPKSLWFGHPCLGLNLSQSSLGIASPPPVS